VKQAIIDAPNDPEAYVLMADIAMRDRDLAKAGVAVIGTDTPKVVKTVLAEAVDAPSTCKVR